LEIGRCHRVPNQWSMVGGGWQPFVFHQKLLGDDGSVRRGVVMVKQPGLFSPKFGLMSSHVFMQLPQNVAVESGINSLACWEQYRWWHQSGIFWIPPRKIFNTPLFPYVNWLQLNAENTHRITRDYIMIFSKTILVWFSLVQYRIV
jgi:hypothetical protein